MLNKAREMAFTQVLPAQSFLDGLWATLQIDLVQVKSCLLIGLPVPEKV